MTVSKFSVVGICTTYPTRRSRDLGRGHPSMRVTRPGTARDGPGRHLAPGSGCSLRPCPNWARRLAHPSVSKLSSRLRYSLRDSKGATRIDVSDAVAVFFEDSLSAMGDVVADVFESIGNAINDLLKAVGDLLDEIPFVGGAARPIFNWLGDIISEVAELVGAVCKGLLGIVGGLVGGVIRIVSGGITGLLARDTRLFVRGLLDIVSGVFGAVVVILGKAVALIQQIVAVQRGKRALDDSEHELLERVFRGSVALYNVRIVEGFAGLYSINSRPFTLGNTIYMKDRDPADTLDVLVHECVHAWQYQHRGTRYASDALMAQWFDPEGYDWAEEVKSGVTRWEDFNTEAQGKFLEVLFSRGRSSETGATGNGVFFDDDQNGPNVEFMVGGTNHTNLARQALSDVRSRPAWRFSRLWS